MKQMMPLFGMGIAGLGIVGIVFFKLCFVNPAYNKLPDGNYGELFGIVSFFRMPVYVILWIVISLGILIFLKTWERRKAPLGNQSERGEQGELPPGESCLRNDRMIH
jgi:hypothetical protein